MQEERTTQQGPFSHGNTQMNVSARSPETYFISKKNKKL
jgi:hypothetical protein